MLSEARFLDEQGRLQQWPSKRHDKLLVLAYLATKFRHEVVYSEVEVNELLKKWHTFSDWPLLRRELFDSGFLSREPDGSNYQLKKLATGLEDLVLVRPNIQDDAPLAVKWLEGPSGRETLRLMANTDAQNKPSTLEEEQQRLREFITSTNQITWMLRYHGQTVGAVWLSLDPTNYLPAPSIHIMIGDLKARGQGIGRAAFKALIEQAEKDGQHEYLYSRHLLDNVGSAKLLQSIGFIEYGKCYKDDDGLSFQNVKLNLKTYLAS